VKLDFAFAARGTLSCAALCAGHRLARATHITPDIAQGAPPAQDLFDVSGQRGGLGWVANVGMDGAAALGRDE
jgi:hypothetical protein